MLASRTGFVFSSSNTMAATGNSLLYGALLDGKAANASMTVYNVSSSAAPNWTDRVLVINIGRSTGSKDVMFPVPVACTKGIYCSLSAGSVGAVYFTDKT